ncbi:MAG: hypothetical protein IJ832_03950 [Bacteroidaceae bacterium]|nr:hypothetical protein [Bacteroidaceae bacterium]
MKTKKLFFFAAMLLVSVCGFAQSGGGDPIPGDVNEDGVVDVGDIVAVIDIIQSNTPITYYWYVGTTKPTSLTYDGVTTVSSYQAEQTYTNNSGVKAYIYVLTNSDKTVDFYDPSDLSTPSTKTEDTTTISGYKITNMNVRCAIDGDIVIKIL